MIEELCEFLVRIGFEQNTADEIHDAYYEGDIESAAAEQPEPEVITAIIAIWQKQVGER